MTTTNSTVATAETMTREESIALRFTTDPSFKMLGKFYDETFGVKNINTTVMSILMKKETSHIFLSSSTAIVNFRDESRIYTKRGYAFKFHAEPNTKLKIGNTEITFANIAGVNTARDASSYIMATSKTSAIIAAGDWSLIYWGKSLNPEIWKDEIIFELVCVKAGNGNNTFSNVKNNIATTKNNVQTKSSLVKEEKPKKEQTKINNSSENINITDESLSNLIKAMQNNALKNC